MYKNGEGTVIILDDHKIAGVLTERDVVKLLDTHTNMQQAVINVGKKNVISINLNRTIGYALNILIDNHIRRLVIANDDGTFAGIVTQEMLIDKLEDEHYRVDLKVSQILFSNTRNIISLPLNSILDDVVSEMSNKKVGAVLIKEHNEIVGIITERDFVRFISNSISMDTPTKEIMSTPVICINMNDAVTDVVEMMQDKHIRRVLVKDEHGEPFGVIGTRDIIKNIKGNYGFLIENKLKYTKQAFNTINEVILELYIDRNNTLIQWGNQVALDLYGRKIIDRPIDVLIDKETWSTVLDLLLRDGKIHHYKLRIKDKWYIVSCNHFESGAAEHSFLLICKDITLNEDLQKEVACQIEQLRQKDKQLIQQSHHAQMGEMLSMIAHQWRQPLAAIGAASAGMELKAMLHKLDCDTAYKKAQDISRQAQHLSTTINDFKDFFKPNKVMKEINHDDLVKSALGIIHTSIINHNIQLHQNLNSHDEFYTYPNELKQVILNLLKNAEDVLIEKDIKNPYIKISTYKQGDKYILEISDNGGGVEKEILEDIFDPYFSTKSDKNGTGLGLYMSKTIIEEHCKGKLYISNTEEGALFTISLENLTPAV